MSAKVSYYAALALSCINLHIITGGAGFVFGGAAGIIKGTAPFLFATASGLQTFALGATFTAFRNTLLEAWTPDLQARTPNDLLKASTISGGVAGGLVGMVTRGRANALPGLVMFSIFGCLGQMAHTRFTARPDPDTASKPGFWRRMSEKSFSPVKVMSNEEYADWLREKMLRVDVEISILEDKIAALRKEQEAQDAAAESSKSIEK